MISGKRRQNCAILPTSLIMNARKLHAKRSPNLRVGINSSKLQAKPEKTKTRIVKHTTKSSALAGVWSLYQFHSKINEKCCFLQARPKSLFRSSRLTEKKQYETMLATTCTKIHSRNDLVDPPELLKQMNIDIDDVPN